MNRALSRKWTTIEGRKEKSELMMTSQNYDIGKRIRESKETEEEEDLKRANIKGRKIK